MSLKKLGIGVTGVGEMGRRHALNLRLIPEARLMAVADVAEKPANQVALALEIAVAAEHSHLHHVPVEVKRS